MQINFSHGQICKRKYYFFGGERESFETYSFYSSIILSLENPTTGWEWLIFFNPSLVKRVDLITREKIFLTFLRTFELLKDVAYSCYATSNKFIFERKIDHSRLSMWRLHALTRHQVDRRVIFTYEITSCLNYNFLSFFFWCNYTLIRNCIETEDAIVHISNVYEINDRRNKVRILIRSRIKRL